MALGSRRKPAEHLRIKVPACTKFGARVVVLEKQLYDQKLLAQRMSSTAALSKPCQVYAFAPPQEPEYKAPPAHQLRTGL